MAREDVTIGTFAVPSPRRPDPDPRPRPAGGAATSGPTRRAPRAHAGPGPPSRPTQHHCRGDLATALPRGHKCRMWPQERASACAALPSCPPVPSHAKPSTARRQRRPSRSGPATHAGQSREAAPRRARGGRRLGPRSSPRGCRRGPRAFGAQRPLRADHVSLSCATAKRWQSGFWPGSLRDHF